MASEMFGGEYRRARWAHCLVEVESGAAKVSPGRAQ